MESVIASTAALMLSTKPFARNSTFWFWNASLKTSGVNEPASYSFLRTTDARASSTIDAMTV